MIQQELEQCSAFFRWQVVELRCELSIDVKRRPVTSMVPYHDRMNGLGVALLGFVQFVLEQVTVTPFSRVPRGHTIEHLLHTL